MIRIIGNSTERVPIKDLGDVVYYRQIKDYTDEEFENSLDLKRAIRQGKLSKIEENRNPRNTAEIPSQSAPSNNSSININDLRTLLKELVPAKNNGSSDLTQAIREIGPLIADMVRQEISKLSVVQSQSKISESAPDISSFIGPEYVPTVDTSGMVSNVEAEQRKATVNDVDDNLAVLRKLRNKSKSK